MKLIFLTAVILIVAVNAAPSLTSCGIEQFDCQTFPKTCIDKNWWCDGELDCLNGSDESDCPGCPAGHYPCMGSKLCVPTKFLCDGEHDCPNGEDEANCSEPTSTEKPSNESSTSVLPTTSVSPTTNTPDSCSKITLAATFFIVLLKLL